MKSLARLARRTKPPLVRFPHTRVIAMTWTIPEEFGGLTSVLLRRSAKLAELGDVDVPLLTFDAALDVEATTRRLTDRGALGARVHLRNCWSEIADMDDAALQDFTASADRVPDATPTQTGTDLRADGPLVRIWQEDGRKRLVEHLRADGTVSVRDERACEDGRGLVVLDRGGTPVGRFTRARDLYFAWIDLVVGKDSAVILNDSKFVGAFLHHYRRAHVRTVQVFHNPHLKPSAVSVFGPYTASRAPLLFEHARFDGLAFLTQRQADEFTQAFPRRGPVFVVPNSRDIPENLPDAEAPRDSGSGIVLARLSRQKRVDHTVRALGDLQRESPEVRVHIDVFGSGPEERKVAELIESEGVGERITLQGYDTTASSRLSEASFLVLSSRYEGLPLVLVEAMAAGCIPVAYDVRYGPGDVITHGVDGFVVPAGDVRALAAAIREIVTMPEARRVAMRRAAQRTARRYDDLTVTRAWADACAVLTGPRARRLASGSGASATRARFQDAGQGDLLISGTALGDWPLKPGDVRMRAATADRTYGFELPVTMTQEEGAVHFTVQIPAERLGVGTQCAYDFWLTAAGSRTRRRVVAADDAIRPGTGRGVDGRGRLRANAKGNLQLVLDGAD